MYTQSTPCWASLPPPTNTISSNLCRTELDAVLGFSRVAGDGVDIYMLCVQRERMNVRNWLIQLQTLVKFCDLPSQAGDPVSTVIPVNSAALVWRPEHQGLWWIYGPSRERPSRSVSPLKHWGWESKFSLIPTFCSMQVLTRLDKVHPH